MPGNETILPYGAVTPADAETVKMTILFISPCGEAALPCAEVILLPSITNLPSFYVIVLPNENKLLRSKVISAYGKMFALDKGFVDPYADVKKMAGSFIGLGNEVISADDDVTLLLIDRVLPSAEAILPSGLPTELSSVSVKIFLPRPLLLLAPQFLKGVYRF